MRHLKTLASALVVVLVLVMATDYIALAATGKTLILGGVNNVTTATTINKKTTGPAIDINNSQGTGVRINTRNGKAPLRVTQSAKVKHLNADLLDGKNASALSPKLLEFRSPTGPVPAGNVLTLDTPKIAPGVYLATYSVWMDNPQPAPSEASPLIVQCYLATYKDGVYVSSIGTTAMTTTGNGSPGLSGAGALTINSGEIVELFCLRTVVTTFNIIPDSPIQITLTKMNKSKLTTVAARSTNGRVAPRK